MAFKDAEFQYTPEHLFVDPAGKVYLAFDDANDESMTDWAHEVVANNSPVVNVELNLPELTQSIIDVHQLHAYQDQVVFDESSRSRYDALRQQLTASLALLDKVEFVAD